MVRAQKDQENNKSEKEMIQVIQTKKLGFELWLVVKDRDTYTTRWSKWDAEGVAAAWERDLKNEKKESV